MINVSRWLSDFALPYLVYVTVFSNDLEFHIRQTKTVFERLEEAGLTVKFEKCQVEIAHVNDLGHEIVQDARRHREAMITAVQNFAAPKTKN